MVRTGFAELAVLQRVAVHSRQVPCWLSVLREVAQLQVTYCQPDDGRLVCTLLPAKHKNKREGELDPASVRTPCQLAIGCVIDRTQRRRKRFFSLNSLYLIER